MPEVFLHPVKPTTKINYHRWLYLETPWPADGSGVGVLADKVRTRVGPMGPT